MKLKHIPLLAVVAGVLGAVLRGMNLNTGYEPGTCLPIPGNLPQTLLIALSVLAVVLFLLVGRMFRPARGALYLTTFGCQSSLYKTVAVVSGVAMGAAGVAGMYRVLTGATSTFDALGNANPFAVLVPLVPLWLLAILSTASFIVLASAQARGQLSEKRALLSIIPMFWACFDLIITFKDNGASPFVSLYAFELFAAIALVFAFYTLAGFFYAKSNPGRFVAFASLAVFFCLTCVGGYLVCALLGGSPVTLTAESVLRYVCFLGAAVYLLANLVLCTRSLGRK